jgi:DNA polymerase III delta prime subunit
MWVEKYRPKIIAECILSEDLSNELKGYISASSVPNLLFHGIPGTGKSSVARCIANERGANFLFINAARDNGIDFLRSEITSYVSTIGLEDTQKIVVLDEADGLTSACQDALKSFLEQFADTSIFIFTANYPNKLIPALRSRMTDINFSVTKDDFSTLGKLWYHRVKFILETEEIDFDNKILIKFLKHNFPDYRKSLNLLESYVIRNKEIDEGILNLSNTTLLGDILKNLRLKNFDRLKELIFSAGSINYQELMEYLFFHINEFSPEKEHPSVIILLSKYAHTDVFVLNKRINMLALLSEIIVEITLK